MPSAVPLQIAIIGAGPGGLGAAIFLSRLENVKVRLYEQASELREIGAGIHLQGSTYRMLDKAGAFDAIARLGSSGTTDQPCIMQHRNGRTLEVLKESNRVDAPRDEKPVRTERATLQKALLQQVPDGVIHLRKKLVSYTVEPSGIVRLVFGDGGTDEVDLLVGADGLRSLVRQLAFPSHQLAYTGQMGFRTLIPFDSVKNIPRLPDATVFFHGPSSHAFTTQVGNGKFEISLRAQVPGEGKVSWGQDILKEEFLEYFTEFDPTVRAILDAAPSTGWRQFAMFSGPQLDTLISGPVALVGDASHPLAGAFGAGAGFALEDAYVLSLALAHAQSLGKPISYALNLFDQTRTPHYHALYAELARSGAAIKSIPKGLSFDDLVEQRIKATWGATDWIYAYNADAAWAATLAKNSLKA